MHSYTVDTSCICCSDKKCYLCKTYKREKEINKRKENSLSEAQEKWIKNKENQLTQLIQNNWPLSDDDWTFVADFLTKTMTLARDNEEIRKRLLDILEFYDKKDKEEKYQKK